MSCSGISELTKNHEGIYMNLAEMTFAPGSFPGDVVQHPFTGVFVGSATRRGTQSATDSGQPELFASSSQGKVVTFSSCLFFFFSLS